MGRVSQCKHIRYKIKLDNLQSQSGQLGIEMGTHRGRLGKKSAGPCRSHMGRCGNPWGHNVPAFVVEAFFCAMDFMCNHSLTLDLFRQLFDLIVHCN